MSLRQAFIIWLSLFVGIFIVSWLCSLLGLTQYITFFYYLGAGIFLSKKVLANLIEWHPIHNTIDNVSSAKLGFALLWPIRYLVLFFKLGVLKAL
ncbi:MAG: hypothetical protein Q4F77_02475 [Acinetobacter sp.]|uniref:hypothetical protein n=1 Tax=Acinetobacter sp. TaxID=472 RepID=UPI0026DF45FD|nr:hypothetical protein [Acinetobacter sp.]MDO5542152.1 hypothetical protein [Acinetobacter sp.]